VTPWVLISIAAGILFIIVIIIMQIIKILTRGKIHKGIRLINDGHLDEGIQVLKKVTAIDEYNVQACWHLAGAYFDLHNWHYALYELKKLTTTVTGSIVTKDELHLKLAAVYEALFNYEDALKEYLYVATLRGGQGDAIYCTIAGMYKAQKNYNDAKKYYLKACEINNKNETAAFELGKLFYAQKQYEYALEYLKSAVAINDSNNEAHYYIGNIYYSINNYKAAIPAYIKARTDNALAQMIYFYLGDCYFQLEQFKPALEALEKSLHVLKPHDTRRHYALYNLGVCYENWRMLSQAIKYYHELYTLNPTFKDIKSKYTMYKDIHEHPNLGEFLTVSAEEFSLRARKFVERMGYEVNHIHVGDNGIFDIISTQYGVESRKKYLWRLDRITTMVTAQAIEALLDTMRIENIQRGVYVSAFYFEKGLEQVYAERSIELLDRDTLIPTLDTIFKSKVI